MGLLDLFRRKREDEAARVARLQQIGRIVEGRVLDVIADAEGKGTQVFYSYHVSRVEYESSQLVNPQQPSRTPFFPGAQALVRYDPRQPANSIVV